MTAPAPAASPGAGAEKTTESADLFTGDSPRADLRRRHRHRRDNRHHHGHHRRRRHPHDTLPRRRHRHRQKDVPREVALR